MIKARVLNDGTAQGLVLVLTEPLSFWGAYDPRTGCIVDSHHPQTGQCLAGHVLMLPETRGSGGTPGGIAEAIRRSTAPLGIILIAPDINLAVGAAVAARLYDKNCPVLSMSANEYETVANAKQITIARGGQITI
jgi:uncharacterized protein